MEQQCSQIIDLEKFQSHLSRYRGDLRFIHLSQPKHDYSKQINIKQTNTKQDELIIVYDLLQSMHASIGQDIADLEAVLVQSGQHQSLVSQQTFDSSDVSNPNTLSCKENEVLNMFAKGYSYNEVAGLLGCKLATIQTHAKRIYKKLHVHSRSEAVYEARQMDIIAA